jgi:hypothetical protein
MVFDSGGIGNVVIRVTMQIRVLVMLLYHWHWIWVPQSCQETIYKISAVNPLEFALVTGIPVSLTTTSPMRIASRFFVRQHGENVAIV